VSGSNTDISSLNAFTSSQDTKNSTLASYTSSIDTKFATIGSQSGSWAGGGTDTGSLMTTGSVSGNVLTFTKGNASTFTLTVETGSGGGGTIDTGSFATTGSNTFTGDQVFNGSNFAISGSTNFNGISNFAGASRFNSTSSLFNTVRLNNYINPDVNFLTLDVASGSIVLATPAAGNGMTGLGHLSSSNVSTQVNLMFKNSTTAADTIISGSNNIFTNPGAPTAGFKRYIGASNYYPISFSTPQISGSMGWSPLMSGNIMSHTQTNSVTFRGPVSSSTSNINSNILMGGVINLGTSAANNFEKAVSGVNATGNALFNGTLNQIANTTTLSGTVLTSGNLIFGGLVNLNHISSSIQYNSNVTNGSTTVNNRYFPISGSSAAVTSPRANTNTLYGTGHVINFDGANVSTTLGKAFTFNILAGTFCTASVPDGDLCNVNATGMIGNGLTVIGSTSQPVFAGADAANSGQGSLFSGRFNAQDGTKSKTAETVFAVGTGTSYSNRKTGFLIDSGSNTFVEGTLNVSGSTSMTGSLTITGSATINGSPIVTANQTGSNVINIYNGGGGSVPLFFEYDLGNGGGSSVQLVAPTSLTGSVQITSGSQITLPTGSNQQAGTAVLSGTIPATVVVSNSLVTANSIIMLTKQSITTAGTVSISSKGSGTFTIESTGANDADTVGWFIINNS
jgi:hypothetical protein